MVQAVGDATTVVVSSTMGHCRRFDRPVDRCEMPRMLLAGVHHKAEEAAGKWHWDPYPMTNILHPHLEEARDWLTGSPNVSRAATPREKWGYCDYGEHATGLPHRRP
eukprot:9489861-Pyramimonas_sp.AAC.1